MDQKSATARELYQLRKLKLEAERQDLLARLKHNWLQTFLLGLERKYDRSGTKSGLDALAVPATSKEASGEPVGHENPAAQRPA